MSPDNEYDGSTLWGDSGRTVCFEPCLRFRPDDDGDVCETCRWLLEDHLAAP